MRTLTVALALGLATSAVAAAEFQVLDRPTARRLAESTSHRQPTIVALWSTDCVHCKANFQLLGELSRQAGGPRVVTVAVEPEKPEASAMLSAYRIKGTHYAYGDEAPEALNYAIDSNWAGELPRTLLFNGRGGRQAISGRLDAAVLRKALGN